MSFPQPSPRPDIPDLFSHSREPGSAQPRQDFHGKTSPRLWPRPLRPLTPATSHGYAVIAFAYSIGIELLPWQRWILVHALEILPSGRYRFRNVIVIVARQNGKTTLLKVLALWFMLHGGARMVLGTSTNLEYAREAWNGAVELAIEHDDPLHSGGATVQRGVGPLDDPLFGTPTRTAAAPWIKSVKYGALDTSMLFYNGARYKIATAGRRGGRSLSCDLVIADELREHKTWDAWGAASGTTTARPNPQIWGISNMGDQESIVLNHFIDAGESAIALGDTETDIGLFSYSAAPGADLTDRDAWRQANPSVGWIPGFTESTLEGKSKLPPTVFRPEHMCIPIDSGNPGFNGDAWRDSGDPNGTMDAYRSRVVCGVDVSPDLAHVSLIAVADTGDGRARCEPVAAWTSTEQARQELPDWIARVKPRAVVWFPTGPAAAIAPVVSLSSRWTMPGRPSAPPERVVPRATRAFTRVSSQWPGAGCTTSPAGLSTTSTDASSYSTRSGMSCGSAVGASGGGTSTDSEFPV